MFSDHMKESSRASPAGLLMAAGGLAVVCLLVALALVAERQVQRASVRDLQRVAQQLALADCIQRSSGAHRHLCIRQMQLESGAFELAVASPSSQQDFNSKNVAIAGDGVAIETADMMRVGVPATR
jgi:hypothetical protein